MNNLIIGMRRSGKSTFVKNSVKMMKKTDKIVVVDGCYCINNFYNNITEDENIYENITDSLKNLKNSTLIIDNITNLDNKTLFELLKQRNNTIFIVCQTIEQLKPEIRDLMDSILEI